MKKHCCQPFIDQLLAGKKTVEGRLRTESWATVQVGDGIEFFDADLHGQFEVIGLSLTKTFEELYDQFGQQLLPGVTSKKEAGDIYRQWFSDEKVQEFGVIGITVRRIR